MKWTLGNEKLIAMALVKSEQNSPQSRAELETVVCVGKVVAHRQLGDGRYKLLLMGAKRAVIETELSAPQLFRTAQVRLLEDDNLGEDLLQCEQYRSELVAKFSFFLSQENIESQNFQDLLKKNLSIGALTDTIASTLDLDLKTKYMLLESTDVRQRVETLLAELAKRDFAKGKSNSDFPPRFSEN